MTKQHMIGFVLLVVFCIAFLIDVAFRGPKAKQHQTSIVEALQSIKDVRDANVLQSWAGAKTSSGSAGRKLVSGLPVTEVRAFYVKQFEEQGWESGCERFIGERDRIVYKRDEDTAVLELPKLESQITGEFSLLLSWGTNYC